jgi:hypothetical protein
MSERIPPDDEDWSRRWLRRRRIPCEGGQLRAALDALDGAAWGRLKAAWRQHEQRDRDPIQSGVARALNAGKRLGPVWCRLIAWGIISEADARLLASQRTASGVTFYDDAGARFVVRFILTAHVQAVRKAEQADLETVAYALGHLARKGDRATLDDRVVAFLEREAHMKPAEVRRHLEALRESGDYERVIREADEEE